MFYRIPERRCEDLKTMLTLKTGFGKEMFHRFFKTTSEELRILRDTIVAFANVISRNLFVRFASNFRKKEALYFP